MGTPKRKSRTPTADIPKWEMAEDLFTTGQVARLMGVATRTVSKWVDGGLLKGYRLPDVTGKRKSRDRRVERADLERFAAAMRKRLPWQLAARVVCVGCAAAGCEPADAAEAGAAAARGELAGALLGCDAGLDAALGLARSLGRLRPGLVLGLVLPPDRSGADVPDGLFAAVYGDGTEAGFAALAAGGC